MKRLKAMIERRTGTVFGVMARRRLIPEVPPGTAYVRIGHADQGLCDVELGTSRWFFYFDRVAR